jgi:hypothetical protein
VASERNKALHRRIAEEEKKLIGMSDMDVSRPVILENIKALSLQLEQEPHWTTVPTFWITILSALAGCIAAYYGYLSYHAQSQQAAVATPASVQAIQHSGSDSISSQKQSEPKPKSSQSSK